MLEMFFSPLKWLPGVYICQIHEAVNILHIDHTPIRLIKKWILPVSFCFFKKQDRGILPHGCLRCYLYKHLKIIRRNRKGGGERQDLDHNLEGFYESC